MDTIVSQVVIVLISVIFGGLFTYFIASLTQRKVFKSIAQELTTYHERIYHKRSVESQLKEQETKLLLSLKEHAEKCVAAKEMEKLKVGVIWLVVQAGGSPKDIGIH